MQPRSYYSLYLKNLFFLLYFHQSTSFNRFFHVSLSILYTEIIISLLLSLSLILVTTTPFSNSCSKSSSSPFSPVFLSTYYKISLSSSPFFFSLRAKQQLQLCSFGSLLFILFHLFFSNQISLKQIKFHLQINLQKPTSCLLTSAMFQNNSFLPPTIFFLLYLSFLL